MANPTLLPSQPYLIPYTLWTGGLYDIDRHTRVHEPWEWVCARLSEHLPLRKKTDAPGFGPYELRTPHSPCSKHRDLIVREGPHRCDEAVVKASMLVFDVDLGTAEAVSECRSRLTAAGLAQHWYTTYSWTPTMTPSPWRLVMPLTQAIDARDMPKLRLAVLRHYAIPADPKKCSGRSHFYFLPAHSISGSGRTVTVVGVPLDGYSVVKPGTYATEVPYSFTPPAMPEGPIDLEKYRVVLREAVGKWARSNAHKDKAVLLERVLAGKALAGPHERNDATTRITGMIAWILGGKYDEVPAGVLMAIIRPSLEAMRAEGSKLTDSQVEGMYLRSLEGLAASKAQDEALKRWMEKNATPTRSAVGGDT